MGGAVVMDLLAELKKDNGYHLTFDNLFSSLCLVDKLTSLGIACTGKIRSNRVQDCPLPSVKDMQKEPCGAYNQAYDASNGLVVVKWNNNNTVTVVSKQYLLSPLQTASRWSRSKRRRIRIEQPYAVKHYNRTMNGVDSMDQNVEKYRMAIWSKKWWSIFMFCIDLAIQQTWHLYLLTKAGKESHLDLLGVEK